MAARRETNGDDLLSMNLLEELRGRFAVALTGLVDDPTEALSLIRPAQDARFGDYQANAAMPLGKKLGRNPRDVAAEIADRLEVADLCETPEIAGPGFINLRIRDEALVAALDVAMADERLGVAPAATPRTIIVDFSAPNVAKPMHVGHIRSTAIGRSIANVLTFLGHRVIRDNHLGDWGTQFGMIIYGYRNFLDAAAYQREPVQELARVYRIVSPLIDYYDLLARRASLESAAQAAAAALASFDAETAAAPDAEKKARKKQRKKLAGEAEKAQGEANDAVRKIGAAESDAILGPLVAGGEHADIGRAVLRETAKLHEGDAENLRLWREFMPPCLAAIQQVYDRLGVTFDETLGESFYHDRLPGVVADFQQRGLATESDGAICLFLEGHRAPMIIQKQDGAFLYATTDLATIKYRAERWAPDAILYVVDHRQSLHFEQLFAAASLAGCEGIELTHVAFGTVLGEDGRPFKTRSGDAVGLWGLLDEAAAKALDLLAGGEGPARDMPPEVQREIAEAVGMGALVYADLAQNRTSDYVFSYDKMLAMNGNTAAYMQYAYARVRSIFSRGEIDPRTLRDRGAAIRLADPAERALALALLRFSEALDAVVSDYRPHHLTTYLFELAGAYSTFFEACPVLKAADDAIRDSRLMLCDLTARTIRTGLELLGIRVVERM